MRIEELNLEGLSEALLQLSALKRILLVLAGWLVLGVAAFFLFWKSDLDSSGQLERDINDSLARLNTQSQLLLEQPAIEAELVKLEAQLPVLKKALPSERELASLLDRINQMILDNSLHLSEFTPQPSKNLEVMRVVPVKVSVKGNGEAISRLPNYIASLSRQVSLKEFEMSVLPETGQWHMQGELHAFAQLPANSSQSSPASPDPEEGTAP